MKEANIKDRFVREEKFHDDWAVNEDFRKIDVIKMNEAVTAPEMRSITAMLGNISAKKLLDMGCGLGEASVYFALKGAKVIGTDISTKMLEHVSLLAKHYNVNIQTYKSTAEDLMMREGKDFDIIYAGNLFHHVDIEHTLRKIVSVMKEDGILVSWDPIAYNPGINIYRIIATKVRTRDEHPLRIKDIKLFNKFFKKTEVQYFWLSTLIIFIIMVLFQFKNPNKIRYWKNVVEEGDKWATLYNLLERFDKILLKIFPPLKFLCWNVVIKATKPKKELGNDFDKKIED